MTAVPPIPKLFLIPAVLAVGLGITILVAHLRQPDIPALPGKGCITTAFPSPDSSKIPTPFFEIESCSHISETLISLRYYADPEQSPGAAFYAIGPEDPRAWNRHLQARWLGADTIEVRYDAEIRFESRETEHYSKHIVYVPVTPGP